MLRWWLRNWLRTAATRAIRERVSEAVRQPGRQESGPSDTPDSADGSAEPDASDLSDGPDSGDMARFRCEVGVVCAMTIEAGCLEDLLEGVVRIRGNGFTASLGNLGGRRVAVVCSGVGQEAARHATEALLAGHSPGWVISAGFAGGLTPELRRHDLLMADGLVDTAGARLSLDLRVDPASLEETPGVHVGRLLSIDRIARLPDEKRELGEKYDALAVDMESFAVAEVCRGRAIRFLAVRVISDTVSDELPRDIVAMLRSATTAAKLGSVLGTAWRRPSSVKDMARLREHALVSSDRLARFLASLVEPLTSAEEPPR